MTDQDNEVSAGTTLDILRKGKEDPTEEAPKKDIKPASPVSWVLIAAIPELSPNW
jgi:hypothetical protein